MVILPNFQRFLLHYSQFFRKSVIFSMPRKETIRGFKEILQGKHDQIPENLFLMAGGIDEVVERYEARHDAEA